MSVARKTLQSAGLGVSGALTWWSRRAAGRFNVLEIKLSGQVVEDIHISGIWQRLVPAQLMTMREMLASISVASEDPGIKLLLIRVAGHDLGWGRAGELCQALREFRAKGKYALAFLEEPENIDFMIASACDRVVVNPGSTLFLTGLLSEVFYFKGIMDKLDIQAELFQAGRYKTAVEPYTRTSMSAEHREAVESMLESIYSTWTVALARSRGMDVPVIHELIDQGPWLAEEALEAGLVDALHYEDELDEYMEKWLAISPRRIGHDKYIRLFGPRLSISDPWKKSLAVAIITSSGPIHGGESRFYGPGEATTGADTMRRALREVGEEDRVAAAVVRVDSPGGSASHSDMIWREVERLGKKKPVVASMADVAASGGYYISMPASEILASPSTITGSIGVIGGKVNLKGLYNKIGIIKEQVSKGAHADVATDYGGYSPELKKKIKKEMESIYRVFVQKAAKARKREHKEMEKSAQGRVWTGEQAKEQGLVDEIGNLLTAVERAKQRAGIPVTRKVPIITLPRIKKPGLPLPFSIPRRSRGPLHKLAMYEELKDSRMLALMPFFFTIK